MSRQARLCAGAAVAFFASTSFVHAQGPERPISNQFRFVSTDIPSTIPTCQPIDIEIERATPTTFGVPPYYMIAYPVNGGTPRRTLLGSDNRTLSWIPNHPPGTSLLLNVVDSTASGGGTPQIFHNVTRGSSTDCVVAPTPAPNFIIWSNVTTGPLMTCQPWGLAFDGGVPPYQLTIASLDSPTITNVTIESNFDAFVWINRAPPTSQLVAAVSDSTGRWASGSPFIRTDAGDPVDCAAGSESGNWRTLGFTRPAQLSDAPAAIGGGNNDGSNNGGGDGDNNTGGDGSGGNNDSDGSDQDDTPAEQPEEKKKKTNVGLIVGVVVAAVAVLLGAIGFGYWLHKRRNAAVGQSESEKNLGGTGNGLTGDAQHGGAGGGESVIEPFDLARPGAIIGGHARSVSTAETQSISTYRTKPQEAGYGQPSRQPANTNIGSSGGSFYTSPSSGARESERGTSETSSLGPRQITSVLAEDGQGEGAPQPSTTARSKAAEAAAERAAAACQNQQPPPADYHSVSLSGDEILIQHRDGGPSIRELPPPYADQSRA